MNRSFRSKRGRLRSLLWFASLLAGMSEPAHGLEDEQLWKLVAQSQIIVVGTVTVPVDQLEETERTGHHRSIEINARVQRYLKGDPGAENITVRYFTKPESYSPSMQALTAANGKESVLFLHSVDDGIVSGVYFAGYTAAAFQSSIPELVRDVTNEVVAQAEIVRHFAENFPPEKEPLHAEVRWLIFQTTMSRWTECRAFRQLEALGRAGVPAMIVQMDDRRELAVKEISLRNDADPDAFEQSRVYRPEVVVDAIDAILNQITGEAFGTIENGASERERRAAVDGWRIYLHRTRFGRGDPRDITPSADAAPSAAPR